MHICCYTSTALPKIGGQELVVDALARRFIRLGHHVVVLAPRPRVRNYLGMNELPYQVAWHPRFLSTRRLVAWYRGWLARLHRKHRFDVLHCHDVYPSAYVAARCAAVASLPLVITSHGEDLACDGLLARKPQLRDRYLLAMNRADAAIAISGFTQRRFRELCPAFPRIERIPIGVNVAQFAGATQRPAQLPPTVRPGEYLLFLGRLDRRKGVDVLLDAFWHGARGTRMGLVIAGDGPERAALQTQAAAADLGDRCWFAGAVVGDTKTWLLQHARCTVMPSRLWEAFPQVVLESYAAGRPVIATRLDGLTSIVEPEQTGLLVPPDAVEPLAQALARAIADRETMERLGRQARIAVQQYDWDDVAAQHLALYDDLLRGSIRRQAA